VDEDLKHPAFGVIGISRFQTTGSRMFGSSINHKTGISIVIRNAGYNEEGGYISADKELIRIRLSSSQFAELITTLNVGDGVPCTIERLGRESIPELPHVKKKSDIVFDDVKKAVEEIEKDETLYMQEAIDILNNKSTITKKDRELVLSALRMYKQKVKNDLPFYASQIKKHMEESAVEAKQEIESYISTSLRSAGIESGALKGVLDE
jgi:hypothetical protein